MNFKDTNGSDSKHFLKLKDKESAVGIFRGEIHDFKQHWANNRSYPCLGANQNCEHCVGGVKSAFRFRLNFITNENGTPCVKIFEQGWNVYSQLKALHTTDYNLEKTWVRITRNGTGMQATTYTIIPLPGDKAKLTPETEKKILTLPLHDLINLVESEKGSGSSSQETEEDLPF